MERAIVGFDQDELGDWRAILACGHRQHVRHNPPLVERPWVLTEEGRSRFLGAVLNCKACDEGEPVNDTPISAAALEAIYVQFRADLLHVVMALVADGDTAEDVLRGVSRELPARAGELHGSDPLAKWLYDIIRAATLERQRQMRPGGKLLEPARPSEAGDGAAAVALAIRGLLDCLPGEYRQALILTDGHSLSPREIAGRLDIAPAAAEARIRRGRAMLWEALLEWCQFDAEGQ